MGEGFEMITKIKQEKITEIIQKLEIFKQNIVQFLDKDTINALESQKYSSLMISRINEEKNEDILKSQIMEEEAKSLLKQNISQIDSLNVNQNSGYTSFDKKMYEDIGNDNYVINLKEYKEFRNYLNSFL